MQTDERPEEGPFLEVWLDIPDVGEPTVVYWPGEEGDEPEAMLSAYLSELDEMDIEVLAQAKPFAELDEWILHTKDPGCGGVAYWIRHRDW